MSKKKIKQRSEIDVIVIWTNIVYIAQHHINHIKSHLSKKLLQSYFLSDFNEIFSSLIVYLNKIFFSSVFENSS